MATKADNFDDYVKQWHAFAEVNGIPVQGVLLPEGTFELRPKPGGIGMFTMYWFRKI